jgi:hypothetical protein
VEVLCPEEWNSHPPSSEHPVREVEDDGRHT